MTSPRLYRPSDPITDNRSAWGAALEDIAATARPTGNTPLAVFDCDLAGSVKTQGLAKRFPDWFYQAGIQEHHTAVAAGAMSVSGFQTFWADFGVFGVDEVYNQLRINDINETNLKLVCTHVGIDVGEDGKTHQCVDYLGLLRNLFRFRAIIPADPNQTDRAVRFVACENGNYFIGMGRSKVPVITHPDGTTFFGRDYIFRYGKADQLREGSHVTLVVMGVMAPIAVSVSDLLKKEGLRVGVLNISCPFALDADAIRKACQSGVVITLEDHHVNTGLGSLVTSHMMENGLGDTRLIRRGVPCYQPSGTSEDIRQLCGLDAPSIAALVREVAVKT